MILFTEIDNTSFNQLHK